MSPSVLHLATAACLCIQCCGCARRMCCFAPGQYLPRLGSRGVTRFCSMLFLHKLVDGEQIQCGPLPMYRKRQFRVWLYVVR